MTDDARKTSSAPQSGPVSDPASDPASDRARPPARSAAMRYLATGAKVVGIVIAVVVLVTAAAAAWLIGTEGGTRFALARTAALLPPGIDLGTAHGRLGDDLELRDVAVVTDTFELTVTRLWLRWSPTALLGRRLEVEDLGAEGVRYRALPGDASAPPAAESEPFALPERIALPVSVQVRRVSIEDVAAVLAADIGADVDTDADVAVEPIIVERMLLADVSFVDSRLELDRLEIESPLLSATGRAAAVAANDYPLDARLDWQLRLPDYAELVAQTALGGSLAALTIEQQIAAPYSLSVAGSVRELLEPAEPVAVALDLDIDALRLIDVQAGLPDATLTVAARLQGPVDALEVALQASGIDPAERRFTADLAATVAADAVTIRELAVRQPGRDGVLEGSGTIALAGETRADLAIRWSALQWPLTGEPTVVSPRGALEFDGPLSAYRISVDTRLEPSAAPPVDLRLAGDGNLESIALTLEAQEREGTLTGSVEAVWSPSVHAEVALDAANFDPSPFAADWPGAIDLALAASGSVDGDDIEVVVDRLEAAGTLRGQRLAAAGSGRYEQAGEQYRANIAELRAALGDTLVEVSGEVAEQANVAWRLVSDDLSAVLPQAAGAVEATGSVSGPIPRVRVAARIGGRDLAFDEHRVARIDVNADLDLGGEQTSGLSVVLRDALVAGTAVGSVVVDAGGTAPAHRISVAVDAADGRAALELTGALADPWGDDPAWQFTLTDGELGYRELVPWRLTAPAAGSVTAETLNVEPHCWQAAEGQLCLNAQRDPSGLAADLELTALRFDYFAAFLPDDIDVDGDIGVAAHVAQAPDGALTAEALVAVSATHITLPADGTADGAATLRLEPSELRLDLNDAGAEVTAALNLEHGRVSVDARATAEAPAAPLAEQSLTGRVALSFPSLAFVADFVPTLEAVEGTLGGALELAGTVGAPAVSGTVELADGALLVPETGIALTALNATLEGLGREGIALAAAAASGGGELSMEGLMSLPGAPLEAHLEIRGDAFQVVDSSDARVFVSPDLRIEADAQRLSVTGTVHVPRAALTPGQQAPSAVTVTADQVLLGDEPPAEAAAERDLFAAIRVSLGNDVLFEGFGLAARIEGEVLVEQEPRTPTTATGELRILDGEYRAYGQGLVIDSGRIYFAGGPITQPALDVRAVRRPRAGIVVGANVQGTLETPSFELFSEPPMTQQEQLSWLVLGRSLQEAPEGEGNALSQAALAMGLRGGDFLAKNIGERAGFDQFGIETGSGEAGAPSDPSEAALVIGKYLSPKLYVSYGVGLFNPESVLQMQYEISRNWTVVTQSSSDATGGDVLYTVEFGR